MSIENIDHWNDRANLAASFSRAAHVGLREAVANRFSLVAKNDGTQQRDQHLRNQP